MLVALVAGQLPVIGLEALGIAPFLVSFLAFTFPLALGLALTTVVWAFALGIPLLTGQGSSWVGMLAILGIVTVSTFLTRVSNARGLEYDRAVERLRLSEERERVARDVHDVLGHSLTVVSVKAELAERLLDVDVERARAELADVRALTRTALAEIRETVGGLRVAVLADEIDAARTTLTGAGIEPDLPTDLTVVDPATARSSPGRCARRSPTSSATPAPPAARSASAPGPWWSRTTDAACARAARATGSAAYANASPPWMATWPSPAAPTAAAPGWR